MNAYPDAKVILTARDADSWYQSFKNTVHRLAVELKKRNKDLPKHILGWNKLYTVVALDGASDDPEQFNDEEAIKAKYNAHVEWVKKNVPSDRLFIMELGEGWERLCKLLDVPVPDVPYPRGNSTKEFVEDNINKLESHIEAARMIDAQAMRGA